MRGLISFTGLVLLFTGCNALNEINGTIEDFENYPETIKEDTIDGVLKDIDDLTVVSAVPSNDYANSGQIDFSMLNSATQFTGDQLRVQVKNRDGSYDDCEYDSGEEIPAESVHLLTMLLDGSGSMELSYPPDEYGDVCVTCPHDPRRERVLSSKTLVRAVQEEMPHSNISIAEFGPDAPFDPVYDFAVTTMLHDFSTDTESLAESLDSVRGYEEHGTPMYDSVAEMIYAAADSGLPGKRGLILLTDGLDNESERFELGPLAALAREHGVAIYAVGLGPASVHGINSNTDATNIDAILALQDLAYATGGFYGAVDDPASIQAMYDTIAETLTDGYRKEKYVCIPSDSQDVPQESCGCPPTRGEAITGRIAVGETWIPWNAIAP